MQDSSEYLYENSEVPETNETETSEISSEFEETSENNVTSENESTSEPISAVVGYDYQPYLESIDHKLDITITFLTIFAVSLFIFWIWKIFYGWFYKSV